VSRYEHQCPACGETIQARQIPVPNGKTGFPCPDCGEFLKFTEPYSRFVWISSIVISPFVAYAITHNLLVLILMAVLGIPVFYLLIVALLALVGTPKLIKAPPVVNNSQVRDGDVSLDLKDRSDR
jgi:predicted RNA-binding Zn-ribbon protein involved in translation (DUF1610 family)